MKRVRDESINISDEKLYPMAQVGFNPTILRNDGDFFVVVVFQLFLKRAN